MAQQKKGKTAWLPPRKRPAPKSIADISDLPGRLHYLMTKIGESQGSLAARFGIGQPHLSGIMNNRSQPSGRLIKQMALVLNCRVEWLQYGTGQVKEDVIDSNADTILEHLIISIRQSYVELPQSERYLLVGDIYKALAARNPAPTEIEPPTVATPLQDK